MLMRVAASCTLLWLQSAGDSWVTWHVKREHDTSCYLSAGYLWVNALEKSGSLREVVVCLNRFDLIGRSRNAG
jgi:hypothetical protein